MAQSCTSPWRSSKTLELGHACWETFPFLCLCFWKFSSKRTNCIHVICFHIGFNKSHAVFLILSHFSTLNSQTAKDFCNLKLEASALSLPIRVRCHLIQVLCIRQTTELLNLLLAWSCICKMEIIRLSTQNGLAATCNLLV